MKSLALLGFILLGSVSAHSLADSETLFLSEEDLQTVQRVQGLGRIDEAVCVFEAEDSIYNLIQIKDNEKNYEVGLEGLEESLNTFSVVFNLCRNLVKPELYNCPEKTKSALVNKDVDGNYTCYPIANETAIISSQLVPPRLKKDFNFSDPILEEDAKYGRLQVTYK
jgi:hypothetical protein